VAGVTHIGGPSVGNKLVGHSGHGGWLLSLARGQVITE